MVERTTRSVCRAIGNCPSPDRDCPGVCVTSPNVGWAALTGVLEPTSGMLDAGARATGDPEKAKRVWTAMAEAALNCEDE